MPAPMRAAMLIDDGFQDAEATGCIQALRDAGHQVDLLARAAGTVEGEDNSMEADSAVGDADAQRYPIVVVPGGVRKMQEHAPFARFVRDVVDNGGVVGAVSHGVKVLVDAEVVAGRRVTGHASISRALTNASGEWQDAQVVADGNIVTGRGDDLPAFMAAVLDAARIVEASDAA